MNELHPVIKWVGGKSKILDIFRTLYKESKPERFIDLFCGSLIIPLSIAPDNLICNDINTGLINMYKMIKKRPKELCDELEKLNKTEYNNKESFGKLKEEFNIGIKNKVRHASIFIYLNKRGFNGLYRENKKGEYNVPFRKYNTDIYKKEDILALSNYFKKKDVQFISKSIFDIDIDFFKEGDLVYLDPPYYPTETSKFTGYWRVPFLEREQKELAKLCRKLDKKGIHFIVSNSPCPEVEKLYEGFYQYKFKIERQMRNAKVGKGEKNNDENEILIWNFPILEIEK